jgi:hypothetical protein
MSQNNDENTDDKNAQMIGVVENYFCVVVSSVCKIITPGVLLSRLLSVQL